MAATVAGARERGEPGQSGDTSRRALYFCGSIRGGREDRALYQRIVSQLRRFGTVLTEHVAFAELGALGEAAGARSAGCRGRGRAWPGPCIEAALPRTVAVLHRAWRAIGRERALRPKRKRSRDSDRVCPGPAGQSLHSVIILTFRFFLDNFLQLLPGYFVGRGRMGVDGTAWVSASRWHHLPQLRQSLSSSALLAPLPSGCQPCLRPDRPPFSSPPRSLTPSDQVFTNVFRFLLMCLAPGRWVFFFFSSQFF